jgi:hypothetical protein
MFDMFILVLFYRYDRVTASLWIWYTGILLGEGLQLAFVRLQIILWLRNANKLFVRFGHEGMKPTNWYMAAGGKTKKRKETWEGENIKTHHSLGWGMNGLDLKCAHEHHTPLSTEYVATGNSTCCRLVEKNYRTTRQFRHRNARSAHPQQETICT